MKPTRIIKDSAMICNGPLQIEVTPHGVHVMVVGSSSEADVKHLLREMERFVIELRPVRAQSDIRNRKLPDSEETVPDSVSFYFPHLNRT